jgi:hypothetical protein
MLELLTSKEYFEYEWNELNIELLAPDFDIDADELNDIVSYCIKLGLLQSTNGFIHCDKLTFRLEESVLIRRKGYCNINAKRNQLKEVNVNNNYTQTNLDEVNVNINEVSDNINRQSKGKESKVEESKVEESKVEESKVEETKGEERRVYKSKAQEEEVNKKIQEIDSWGV